MNVDLHRLVFNSARGMCVAVAETATQSGKSASGEASSPSAARPARATLVTGLTLLAAASLQAQTLPTGGAITQGAGSISQSGAKLIVNQSTPRMVADWKSFSIGAGNTVQFVQPTSSSVALNRVFGNDASQIFGSLLANGHVYLQNANGVLFAPGAQVSVGSLVATSLNTDLRAFMDGNLRLSGGSTASGLVRNEGSITSAPGGFVLLAAPQVSNSGKISTPGGTLALAAGNAVNVDPTGSGLMSISVPVAAVNAQLENSGSLLADGGLVALHAAATDAARRSVMQVGGVVRARSIEARNGQIVLSGGSQGTVTVSGTLDASGTDGLTGGTVKVLGDRVALVDQARLDASGGSGGGTVLVGGNYQGHGPEANASVTSVGKDVVLDASAVTGGNGGTVIIWSDQTTSYAGTANARGGSQRGDGGLVEVSGKQQLNFTGAADLRAPIGKTGRLLLDPFSITIGTTANVNGDSTIGDDVTGNILASDFPSASSQITAAQVASLLVTGDLSLAASNSITVSAPVTVAAGGPTTTLALTAGFNVNINAAMTLRNSSLSATTTAGSGDSIQVNAPIQTANSVALTSSQIRLANSVTAGSVTLTGSPTSFFNDVFDFSTSSGSPGINADLLTIRAFDDIDLTSRVNQVRTLDVNGGTATVNISNPAGTALDLRGNVGSLDLTSASGIVQSTANSGQALTVTSGAFQLATSDTNLSTGQVSLNNPNNSFSCCVRFLAGAGISVTAQGGMEVADYEVSDGPTFSSSAGGNILLTALGGPVNLRTDLTSTVNGSGPNIEISAAGFRNSLVFQLIVPSGGRFVVRSSDYTADVWGVSDGLGIGLSASGQRDFNFIAYNAFTGPEPTSGNGFFSNRIGLLTPGLPTASKVYDGNANFSFALTGTGARVDLQTTSTPISFFTGTYSVNGSGQFADKNAGIDKAYTTNTSTDVTAVASPDGGTYYGLVAQSVSRPAGPTTPTSPLPTSQVTSRSATISGVTANNKVYDSTVAATLSGTPVANTLSTDTVSVAGTPTATFNNKNVGTAKPVTVSGYTLTGTDAANYTLTQPTGLSANITPYSLLLSGISASNKVYDATTAATLIGTPSTSPFANDVVTIVGSGVGTFNNKNVGTAKPVTVTGYTLSGTDALNYLAVQPTGLTANITPRNLAIAGVSAANKVYDATTLATLTGTPTVAPLASDAVTVAGSGVGNFNNKNVGTNKPVTVTGYSLNGLDSTNYAVQQPTGLQANITAASLQVTGVGAANKVYDATTAATLTGTAAIAPLSSDAVTLAGSGVGNFNNKNVGTAKPVTITGYTISGLDAANYSLAQPTGVTADITAASLALAGLGALNKVYDATIVATLTGTPTATPLASDSVTVSGTPVGAFNDKNVGTAKPVTVSGLTLSGPDALNYIAVAQAGLTANITPRNLAVAGVSAANKVYDATTIATLTGTPTVAPLASDAVTVSGSGVGNFNNKNVGTNKPVTVTGFTLSGIDSTNYTVQQPTGLQANITAAGLQVTGVGAANKVYDTTTAATLTGTAAIAPLSSDAVALAGSGVGTFNNKNVGTAKPVTVTGYTLSGLDANNYTLLQPAGITADITPATLTLAGISALNKVYDSTIVATLVGTGTVTPLPGDSVTIGSGTGTFNDKNVGVAKPVTVTGYTLGGPDGPNYRLTLPSTLSADITAAPLAVSGFGAANKVYDSTTAATLSGFATVAPISGDSVSVIGAGTGTFNNKNVGTAKPVIVSGLTLAGPDASNYALQFPNSVRADITPATLAITGIGAADKVYDATTAATLTGSAIVAPLGSDNVGVGGAGQGVFVDKNVGVNKPVTVSGFTLVGPDAANYLALQPQNVTASILAATIPVNGLQITGIAAANKVYDGTTLATLTGTPVVTPLRTDQVAVGGVGVGNFANKNVGTAKPVTVTGFTLTGQDASNYTVLQPIGLTADITAAPLLLTGLSALDKVYDASTVARLSGLAAISAVPGDAVTLNGSALGAFANKNVGNNKAVTVSGFTLAGADAGNYNLLLPSNLTASITPAALALSGVVANNKTYDGNTLASLTGTAAASPLGTDQVTVGGTAVGTFNNKNVGNAKPVTVSGLTIGGADAGNYTLLQPSNLSASITPASLNVSGVSAANKVYDATMVATLTGTALINPVAGDAVVLAGNASASFNNKNVGTAKPVTASGFTLAGADAGNYTLQQPGGLTANITPATVVVGGVGAAPKVYDTTTGVTLTGTPVVTPLGNDNLALQGTGTGVLPDKNAGTARPVQVSGFTLGGADAANYNLVQPIGITTNVAPKTVTPTGIVAIDRPADGTTTVALITTGASVAGVLPGDAVALVTSGAVGTVASPTPGSQQVLVRGLALSGPDAVNYALVPTTDPSGVSGVAIGTVTLLSNAQAVFEQVRNREYLQGVSDAQEPFRRAMAEALAAGFGKENIRKQLQRGLVFETGLAPPAVDTIAPAQSPQPCTLGENGAGLRLACN